MNTIFLNENYKAPVENVYLDTQKNISIDIKREDLIHPNISGNKFRKLKYNILDAVSKHHNTILTYGGAFSNHILATAYAAKLYNLKSIGIIRGEELKFIDENEWNPTLKEAKSAGMAFHFVDRKSYQHKEQLAEIEKLKYKFGNFYRIPEGGTNALAVKGCEEILNGNDDKYNIITCCIGTGGTIAGIINSSQHHQMVYGFSALKAHEHAEIFTYTDKQNCQIFQETRFGGYAKTNDELIKFINQFYRCTSIQLDPVYTGKMMFRIFEMLKQNHFKPNTKILAIHTGGLQGVQGFNAQQSKKGKAIIEF